MYGDDYVEPISEHIRDLGDIDSELDMLSFELDMEEDIPEDIAEKILMNLKMKSVTGTSLKMLTQKYLTTQVLC